VLPQHVYEKEKTLAEIFKNSLTPLLKQKLHQMKLNTQGRLY
jgi:hypothetical protein